MIPFEVVYFGEVNINKEIIPIEYKMIVMAEDERDANDKAYDIAKKAYLTWDYVIK